MKFLTKARLSSSTPYLDAVAAVTMTLAAGFLIWGQVATQTPGPSKTVRAAVPVPSELLDVTDAPAKGDAAARVVVIEYADFECPFCGVFARDTLPALEEQYISTGRVQFAFRHLPLTTIHPTAKRMAEAAECARGQDRFWEFHDALFRNPRGPQALTLDEQARSIGLDADIFAKCGEAPPSDRVQRDVEEARRLGIVGTPTILFGTKEDSGRVRVRIAETGALTAGRAKKHIEELLTRG